MKNSKCAVYSESFKIPEGLKGIDYTIIDELDEDHELHNIDFSKQTLVKIPDPNSEKFKIFKEIPYEIEYLKCNVLGEYSNPDTKETFICCNIHGEPLNLKMNNKGKVIGQIDEVFVKINVKKFHDIIELTAIMNVCTIEKNNMFLLFEYSGNVDNIEIPEKYECYRNVVEKTIEKSFDENIKTIHFYTDVEKHPVYINVVRKFDNHLRRTKEQKESVIKDREFVESNKFSFDDEEKMANKDDEVIKNKAWSIYQLCKREEIEMIYKDIQGIEYIPAELKHKFLINHFVVRVPKDSAKYKLINEIEGQYNYLRMNIFCEHAKVGDGYSNVYINCKPNCKPFDNVYKYNNKVFTQTPFEYINVNVIRIGDSFSAIIKRVEPDIPHPTETIEYECHHEDINDFDINSIDKKYKNMVLAAYEKSFSEDANELFMYHKY